MKKTLVLLTALALFCCKKKDTPAEEPTNSTTTTGSGTTTGGTTTGAAPTVTYAAELSVTNTDYDFYRSYASAHFFNDGHDGISMNSVKIAGTQMGQVPFGENEYRHSQNTATFTPPVIWTIDSDVSHIPDTSFSALPFPLPGFMKETTRVYDKTKDFVINVETAGCDSLYIKVGEVMKKIPGKTGITSVTYTPADSVKNRQDILDVSVRTLNYQVFTVRGRKWKTVSAFSSISVYKYKQ